MVGWEDDKTDFTAFIYSGSITTPHNEQRRVVVTLYATFVVTLYTTWVHCAGDDTFTARHEAYLVSSRGSRRRTE